MSTLKFWLISIVSFITVIVGTIFVPGSFLNRFLSIAYCTLFSFNSALCTPNLGINSDRAIAANTLNFEKTRDTSSDISHQETLEIKKQRTLLAFESYDYGEGHKGITMTALGQINIGGDKFQEYTKNEIDRADRQVDLKAEYLDLTPDQYWQKLKALWSGMFSNDFNLLYKHFSNEQFSAGSVWLISLKEQILDSLKVVTKKEKNEGTEARYGAGLKARQLLGQALHTVQDFYAHSNWIELGHIKDINKDLGRRQLCSYSDQIACANREETTAKIIIKHDNGLVSGAYTDYDQSTLDPNLKKLTSGYFMGTAITLSGREFCDAPKGKVYHGAISCSGFNHDEPNDKLYPIAKALAIEASKDYINLIIESLIKKDKENGFEQVKALMGIEDPPKEDPCKSEKNQNSEQCKQKEGRSNNDPHLATFDGLKYDLQTLGEFILTKSNDRTFEVQARHAPFSSLMTINSAVAVKAGSDRVALYTKDFPDDNTSNPLRVNGKPVTIQGDKLTLKGGGEILKQGSNYVISSPRGEKVLVSPTSFANHSFLNISPFVYNRNGKYSGLLGNVNGNPNDDLQIRGGGNISEIRSTYGDVNKVLNQVGLRLPGALDKAEKVYFDRLYKDFGDSWRVKQEESLFDYPAGKTTENYSDRSFPDKYLTLNMLSPEQIQKAQNACTEAKVTEDLMEGCIFDVGFSGFSEFARATAEINGYVSIVNQLFPGLKIPTTGQFVDQTIQKVKPKVCLFGVCL